MDGFQSVAPGAEPLVISDLDTTLGALEIGVLLSAVFFGITVLQTYTYYRYNENDRPIMKLGVFIMGLLDTLHLTILADVMYTYTVTDYSKTAILDPEDWLTVAVVITQTLLDCAVRILYCNRIWRLSWKNQLIVIPILACSLTNFALGILFAIQEQRLVSLAMLSSVSKWILYAGISAGVVADILISVSQVVLLWKQNAEFQRTRSIIRLLILYSIHTGVFVTLCAISCLLLFATMPHNNVWIAVYFLLPQMLLNSLLATLNVKRNLRESATHGVIELSMSDASHDRFSSMRSAQIQSIGRKTVAEQALAVRIDTITETDVDLEA
ncbi:hypothetical protein CERSUDRAFT_124214 [Gelatoporia subvermispora B]|uniref:DUF6534 domain-containing protein n=1 Tax=Ceriporiopsis subvermispora (strain B) TaxID=914234 RepID=M2QGW3_CERS8|nr:hypothetical protein CERSUDRAFT_124214 [Gelatoporia subvermispora B]